MITREQVADLQPGDVVELRHPDADWTITGPLVPLFGGLGVAGWAVTDTYPDSINARLDVRVIKRAPRPLYVNHPRTGAMPGDYAHDLDADGKRLVLRVRGTRYPDKWIDQDGLERTYSVGRHLRLLVDGETGQVVQ